MNWCDERYVKLYTRKTATWLSWGWQGRALFPLLLQAADGSGLVETGDLGRVEGVALLVGIPAEVVAPGIATLLKTGTIEEVPGGLLLTKFLEAQEATKTEAAKKRDQRARRRAKAREITRHDVPSCPEVSPTRPELSRSVPLQPSPAQLSSLFAGPENSPATAPKREPSAAEAFWEWGQDQATLKRPGRLRAQHKPQKLNAMLKEPLANIGRKGLEVAWARYLEDGWAAERDWPLELFVSKIPALHNAAAKPQPKEEPKCVVLNPRVATH